MAQNPKHLLHERNLLPKKSFGQNFMLDQNINGLIAKATLSLKNSDGVFEILEIGAGTGSLTEHLLKLGSVVHAVERDRDLVPILQQQFHDEVLKGHLIIHEASGTTLNYDEVVGGDGILVGNLPYHLTSTIMINLLSCHRFVGAVFLLQKEVAERFLAEPDSKEYGFLTVLLKLAFNIEKVSLVGRNAFWPVPKVDSAIIKLTSVNTTWSQGYDPSQILSFVKGIFQKRRKKLSTILKGVFSEDDFYALKIDPNARPETLAPSSFLAMFKHTQHR